MIFPIACCVLGAANASLDVAGYDMPAVSYVSQAANLPSFDEESFVMVRHLATSYQTSYGLEGVTKTECTKRGTHLFEILSGICALPPFGLRECNACDDIYGNCPSCGSLADSWDLGLPSADCRPDIVDNKLVWPSEAPVNMSETRHSGIVLEWREALRTGLTAHFCECWEECYSDRKVKSRSGIRSVENWCEGGWVGTRIQMAVFADA